MLLNTELRAISRKVTVSQLKIDEGVNKAVAFDEEGVAARFKKGCMESNIHREKFALVGTTVFEQFACFSMKRFQGSYFSQVPARLTRFSEAVALHYASKLSQFTALNSIQPHGLPLATVFLFEEAKRDQRKQRFPDRRHRAPQFRGKGALAEALARLNLSLADPLEQDSDNRLILRFHNIYLFRLIFPAGAPA